MPRGGDDALGRLDGPVLLNDRVRADLTNASSDERLTQQTRNLAAALLASGPALPLDGVRAVYRALGARLPPGDAPSLAAALAPPPPRARAPAPPPDPAAAARHQALRDAADQAAYDAMVADVTAGERAAAARSGTRVGDFRQQLALGAHVTVGAGTGFAAGWVAAGAVWRDEGKRPIGGLIGLTAALIVEVLLIVLHTRPAPAPVHHPPQSVLDAEAEIAALVVAGAAQDVRARASEGDTAPAPAGDKKND